MCIYKQPKEIITKNSLNFLTFHSARNGEAVQNAEKLP